MVENASSSGASGAQFEGIPVSGAQASSWGVQPSGGSLESRWPSEECRSGLTAVSRLGLVVCPELKEQSNEETLKGWLVHWIAVAPRSGSVGGRTAASAGWKASSAEGSGWSLMVPEFVVDASSVPHLTDRVRRVLEGLRAVFEGVARDESVLVTDVRVSAFVDPEQDSKELVVTQVVRLPAAGALEYWDRLGLAISEWARTLVPELQRIAEERIATEVEWDDVLFPVL